MKFRFSPIAGFFLLATTPLFAQTPGHPANDRYAFGLLDHRSYYGTSWFPEPLRAPEFDVDRELRLDYFHGEGSDRQVQKVKAEVEYNFGLLTLEVAGAYERESASAVDSLTSQISHNTAQGVGGIELAARHPLYQYVSPGGLFDFTLVGALEVAIPSGSAISKDTEIVPQLFQLMRFGEHFSVQTSVGYSAFVGPDAGGDRSLEYNAVFGYNLEHQQLPLPGILRTIPIFELNGSRALSGKSSGQNTLFGTVGIRFNFEPIGRLQPRIGVGYVFPIDQGARHELDWGIVTSLVFEF